ncbi:MAG: hypothetical protein ACRD1L_06130 [Terriglobales bacterium]
MTWPWNRLWPFAALAVAMAAPALLGQGMGVDQVRLGPVALHDHVGFDYHIPIANDPFPHQVREGYGYDGVDLGVAVDWHWGASQLQTLLRITPVARSHFDYDQDTDFEPSTAVTHGDAGFARGRSFGVDQSVTWLHFGSNTTLLLGFGFLRQWTRYHQVSTYDLNSNPSLPSQTVQRLISERAIVYQLEPSLSWRQQRAWGGWTGTGQVGVAPLTEVLLHNYIPTTLAATSTTAYGVIGTLALQHRLGEWSIKLGGSAAFDHSYGSLEGFYRQQFALRFELAPPRFW